MRYTKVVYIGYLHLTKKIVNDFYFNELLQEGFEVEYLDLTHLFFKKVQIEKYDYFSGIKELNSYNELVSYLAKQNNETLFVPLVTYEGRVVKLYSLLTKHNCDLGFFARGVVPDIQITESRKKVLIKLVYKVYAIKSRMLKAFKRRQNKKKEIDNLTARQLKETGRIKCYDYVFKAGEAGMRAIGNGHDIDSKSALITNVNSFDYDEFLKSTNVKTREECSYCVFLDEYLPYHPDFELLNINTIEPEKYYKNLNNFFSTIEKSMNVRVVIAAHPKALNYRTENPFENRKIVFGRTCELVKKSNFVLMHGSTSISFPILFKKSILFLVSQDIQKIMPIHYNFIKQLAKDSGNKIVCFDEDFVADFDLSIDSEKYNNYKYRYLTSPESEKRLTKDIFLQFLKELN